MALTKPWVLKSDAEGISVLSAENHWVFGFDLVSNEANLADVVKAVNVHDELVRAVAAFRMTMPAHSLLAKELDDLLARARA